MENGRGKAGMAQRIRDARTLGLVRRSCLFDADWYRREAHLSPAEDPALHYLRGGWKQHDPSPFFRQESYLAVREDVREAVVCPLAHYLLHGKREQAFTGVNEARYRRRAGIRFLSRLWHRVLRAGEVRRNRKARILVALHLSDPRAAGEIREMLKSLRPYDWELSVTVPEGFDPERFRKAFAGLCSRMEIRPVPDRGRDIAPWLDTLRSRDLSAYDMIYKLATAPQGPDGAGRETAFLRPVSALLSPAWVHGVVGSLLRGEADIAADPESLGTDPAFRQRMIRRELGSLGLSLRENYTFVRHGCFALRAERSAEILRACGEGPAFESGCRAVMPVTRAMERWITGNLLPPAKREQTKPAPHGKTVAFAVSETGDGAVKGDYFTALELAVALEKEGWKPRFLSRGEDWYRVGPETDVLISLLEDYEPGRIRDAAPGLVTVAWARNWFRKWAVNPDAEDYAIWLASGGEACRLLEERLGVPVHLFPIAANAERFTPGERSAEDLSRYGCDYCFTGNRFGDPRGIESMLSPEKLPWSFRIFGSGWEDHPRLSAYAAGRVAYDQMPRIYRSVKILLDDATPSTREAGSVNSRVFDALAAGCLVLTDNAKGAAETFGGLLPVFEDKASLQALLRKYLENEPLRRETATALREQVLENHTYAARARQLSDLLVSHAELENQDPRAEDHRQTEGGGA